MIATAPAGEVVRSSTGRLVGLATVVALLVGIALRPQAAVAILVLFVVFVPLEKMFALRPQKVFRRGLTTDLAHILVNTFLSTAGAIALVVLFAIPFLWLRALDLESTMPAAVALALAIVLVTIGNYWGHRLTHRVPFLWRFHAVHHSIEEMDWVASGRLHPFDQSFTQACTFVPLFLLGYDAGVFGGVAVFVTLLALFQHSNTRLRFPVVRWVINTPEWHHWHHASDAEAIDTNFGLPVVDRLFGTAHLPKGKRPSGFGIPDPVPPTGYVRHLAYPYTKPARGLASTQS